MWGARGPFLPAAATVVAVVTPVVFYAKATEKCNKTLKLVVCDQCVHLLLNIVKHISMLVMLNVAWPKPKL
jgi:hypothetical protein